MEKREGLKKSIKWMLLIFFVFVALFSSILLYSRYITTTRLDVEEYKIIYPAFQNDLHGYKIAHVSDLHYGSTTKKKELEVLVKRINQTKPNLLIFTGDLVDKDTKITEKLVEELEETLKKLDPSILKYEVKGEDDLAFTSYDLVMENASFHSLNDTYECLYVSEEDYILLAGMKSRKDGTNYEQKLEKVKSYLKEEKNLPMYTIFALHEPDMMDEIEVQDYQLVLAGHTHGGQIRLPKIGGLFYPKYGKNHVDTHQKIGETEIFITSGIGTTTVRYRLWNNPSFNLYRLTSY